MAAVKDQRFGDFDAVFMSERGRLFSIAFAVLRDPVEAEDVVQETAAAAWRGWNGRRDPDHTRAWLTTICVRKSTRRRTSLFRRVLLNERHREELARADRKLEADGRHLDLHRAHRTLSRQQRAVVSLHYQYGYTLNECALLMGCSAGTVSSHLSRALARLRKELSDD
jgi:RNA polymerase sigma-70 factor (ECF subfamily)